MLLKNKIALVFGASGGLGQAISKKYIDNGAHVICVGRDLKILESLDDYATKKGLRTTIVQLDVTETAKIKHLAFEIEKRFGRIDILVSTIGILGEVTPLNHYAENIWNQVMNTNLNSHWHIIKNMHNLLLQSNSSTVMFCIGSMSNKNHAYWGAYSVSKTALEQLAKIYQAETTNTNINVHLITPGEMATNLRFAAFPGKDKSEFQDPEEVADIFVTTVLERFKIDA